MSTIVFLHAHPDDESSQTAGMMYLAAQAGHRVELVVATDGALGTPPSADPETEAEAEAEAPDIIAHRKGEVECSAAQLGIAAVHWLGYRDSGMLGWESNDDPRCLWRAPVGQVAAELARILDDVAADVLVGYDHHGLYGHPDHVRVHEISVAAVPLAHRPVRLLFETASADDNVALVRDPETVAILREEAPELAAALESLDPESFALGSDGLPVGLPDGDIRWTIELSADALAAKRRAMECHASQTSDVGFMLSLPRRVFARRFGHEFLTVPEYLDAPGTVGPPRAVSGWPLDEADAGL